MFQVDAVLKEQANPKLVKVVVGGEMEGWLSWSDLIAQADTKHTAVKTHKDEVRARCRGVGQCNHFYLNTYGTVSVFVLQFRTLL